MKKNSIMYIFILAVLITACSPGAAVTPQTASTQASTLVPTAAEFPAGTASPQSTTTSTTTSVSFINDVMPILQSRCLNCHGGEQTKRGLSFSSYASLMSGSENGPVVIPGDPTGSLLIKLVTEGKMPKRGPGLTPIQIQILVNWILAGALNN